jgi:GGDEF domain-containing protein
LTPQSSNPVGFDLDARSRTEVAGLNLLRQIEVAVANGKTTAQACKEAEPPALVGTAYLVPSCSPYSSVSLSHWYKASRADQANALIETSDQALYRAKEKGRNQIELGTMSGYPDISLATN